MAGRLFVGDGMSTNMWITWVDRYSTGHANLLYVRRTPFLMSAVSLNSEQLKTSLD